MFDEIVAVTENRPLTGGHFLLSVQSPRQAKAIRPGQFAMLRLPGRSDVLLRRPMSVYDVKPLNRRLRSKSAPPPGDKLGVLAPLGHGFFVEEFLPQAEVAEEILHVAGGIGIAALLLPARELARRGLSQRLFFGGRTKADLVGLEEFKPLVKGVALATEDGSRGHQGFVTRPLADYLIRRRDRKFLLMVCGPWAMLAATVALARQYGHTCLVSMENRMGCGLGVCLGCCIQVKGTGHGKYQRVCTEGPVFWADKVIWENEEIPKT
jgi:dihydroorotate dehydrogenase electron transfer subunit